MKEKYKITVSEPWDYESVEGKNIITGQILKKVSNQCVVFESSFPLVFGSIEGNLLILFPRFGEERFNTNLDEISVNGGLLLINFDNSLDEAILEKNSKFVIIGRLENIKE